MYSRYINNIRLREEPREPIVGGIPIKFLNNTNQILGGGKTAECLSKIAHLSIPIGLVITKPQKTSYIHNFASSTKVLDDTETIDEQLFNKLYNKTAYQTSQSARKTRRKHRS